MRTTAPNRLRVANLRSEITLRLARPDDTAAVDRLARLDSSLPTAAPHLLALRDGELVAALSLATGEMVADPFRRTLELQALLRRHACGAHVKARRTARPRATPATPPHPLHSTA
jgi:hypothetical protein